MKASMTGFLTVSLLAGLLLTGCGLKGSLYLPGENGGEQPAAESGGPEEKDPAAPEADAPAPESGAAGD